MGGTVAAEGSKGGRTAKAMLRSKQAVCATMGVHNTLTYSSPTGGVVSRPALSCRLVTLTCPGGQVMINVVTADSVDNNSTPSTSQRQRQHKARGV